jgi:uroporphyrinogen-III synthase
MLADWLVSQGARAPVFPLLEIEARPAHAIRSTFDFADLAAADAVVFVSANAAEHGLHMIAAEGGLPTRTMVFAIGEATAAKLTSGGVSGVIAPSLGNDSEALLALPGFHSVSDRRFVIVRGISGGGGRRALQETLAARGARVSILECYERRALMLAPDVRHRFVDAIDKGEIDAISVLSVETLESLVANVKTAQRLDECMMLVPHRRVAEAARQMGLPRSAVVPMSGDALLRALIELKPEILQAP